MKLSLWHVTAALVALASAAPEKRGAFDYAAHLGNLSPYQSAPVPSGMEAALPDDCTVDQVMLVSSFFSPRLARGRGTRYGARMRFLSVMSVWG